MNHEYTDTLIREALGITEDEAYIINCTDGIEIDIKEVAKELYEYRNRVN